jgi:hypothetical protein
MNCHAPRRLHRPFAALLCCLLVLLALPAASTSSQQGSLIPWTEYQGDAANRGQRTVGGIATTPVVL